MKIFKIIIICVVATCISISVMDVPREAVASVIREIFITDPITGDQAYVNTDNQLHVVMAGKEDTNNTTTTVLDPGGINVFTGTATLTLEYAVIQIIVYSDVASATDGLMVQFSPDGTNWDSDDVYTIPADTGKTFSFQPSGCYYRVIYTNGGVIQTEFRLQSILKKTYIKPSSHRIQDPIIGDDDAELMKAVITGQDPDGIFRNVNTTADGDLTISDNSNGLAIAKGDVSGSTFIHKFGNAPDFDTLDGFVTVWDGADDGLADAMVYTYSATANIDSISSSINSDTVDIEVQGLDTNYDLVTQTVTLTGQATATLGTPLLRIFRMINIGATDLAGTVYCYINGATVVSGVPTVATEIRAVISITHNQTLMAIYTIPAGKTGYMRDWYISAGGAKKTSLHEVHMEFRPFGQVFQTKHIAGIAIAGTSYFKHIYEEPEVLLEKTDVRMHVNTDEDAASISAGFDIVLVDN